MKIAILGDVHFGARNDSVHFSKFFEKFYLDIFFPYLDKHKITTIFQLGDVFDRRKYINFASLHACRQYFFEQVQSRGIDTYILAGNHDVFYKNTNDVNSLELLTKEYDRVKIIASRPKEVELANNSFLFVPWICEDNYDQTIRTLKTTQSPVVLGHLELAGFEMTKGHMIEEGMDPSLFCRFEHVFSGHYHHRSSAYNITYVGTPYEITWSDYGDQKGFHIFDTDTREATFITNPFSIFKKLYYNDKDKGSDYIASIGLENYVGCYAKVIVKERTNQFMLESLIDQMEKIGVVDLQVVEETAFSDNLTEEQIINEAEDTLTILTKYTDQLDVGVDNKKLQALLTDLYNEALSIE
jgi:DNA repair exonuclease SbcCD nuclease subunit